MVCTKTLAISLITFQVDWFSLFIIWGVNISFLFFIEKHEFIVQRRHHNQRFTKVTEAKKRRSFFTFDQWNYRTHFAVWWLTSHVMFFVFFYEILILWLCLEYENILFPRLLDINVICLFLDLRHLVFTITLSRIMDNWRGDDSYPVHDV